jgi:tetrahydromethanopterin S-methyltransferase subunit E
VIVAVGVIVIVIGPVIVAVHVHLNATVGVIARASTQGCR